MSDEQTGKKPAAAKKTDTTKEVGPVVAEGGVTFAGKHYKQGEKIPNVTPAQEKILQAQRVI